MSIRRVLARAAHRYRAVFWRSLLVTAAVFLVLNGIAAGVESASDNAWVLFASGVIAGVLTGFGDLFVEGVLLDERAATSLFGILFAASLVYAAGVNGGLLLLVVPGAFLATRWSLIVPVIVLERVGLREGFRRSSRLVKGHGWKVFAILVVLFVGEGLLESFVDNLLGVLGEFYARWIGGYVASLIAVPYIAHALAELYHELSPE